jgi:hypothetical protein
LNRSFLAIVVVVAVAAIVVVVLRKSGTYTPTNESTKPSAAAQVVPAARNITSPVVPVSPPSVASTTPPALEPPYAPSAVATLALSNVVDKRVPFDERVHGLTSGAVPEVKNQQDLDTLAKQLCDPKEDEVVRHEIVNLLFRSNYPELEPLLFKILKNPAEDQKFRAWTVQHIGGLLTNRGDIPVSPDLLNRVRKILTDRDLHVRREALLALSRANDPQTLEAVSGMLKSESPEFDGMRDLAIRIAQTKNLRDQIPLIHPYLTSTNDTLRIAAMDTLSKWQDQESRPAIETALKEGSYRVKLCAQRALKTLDTPQK